MTYGMHDFLQDLVSDNIPPDEKIYAYLSPIDTQRLRKMLRRLDRIRSLNAKALAKTRDVYNKNPASIRKHKHVRRKSVEGAISNLLGRVFEEIVGLLCDDCKVFLSQENIRTSTAEIDVLFELGPLASAVPMLKKAGSHLLGEAKCYTSGLKTEWVNELVGIMNQHNCDHSILFLASPSKTLAINHRHGLQLHAKDGKLIVPFGMKQLSEIAQGSNFLSVLSRQYIKVQTGATSLGI